MTYNPASSQRNQTEVGYKEDEEYLAISFPQDFKYKVINEV